MATIADASPVHNNHDSNGVHHLLNGAEDPFTSSDQTAQQPYTHRFSSRFELDHSDLGATSSPSQVKRVLEAHLLETERRLQDTHKLGTSLLQQQSELQEKLQEVEQQQDEAEISPELKQRLASIGREHDDVSREIARSLLAPKQRVVSMEEQSLTEPTTLTSQATASPTKISAPNRRSRNQPVNRAGDLQFAADISTSLLAQVRQLQAAVAERDEAIKTATTQRSTLEQDLQLFAQKLRSHDDNEQKYKDENWNLQAQTHELLAAQRGAADKEKRLNATIAHTNAEKARLIAEVEEFRLAQSKALEEHEASKKAHETELHSLKRDYDAADTDRLSLQNKIDELTSQNHELAAGMAARFRNQSPQRQPEFANGDDDLSRDLSTPEHSPPPSPTKATPRHGGLESETLKSSLHHAHRMIQNLKGNIHREKTEKIELKRMLQDARDELEQRRNDTGFGSGSKKPKARNEVFKKPIRSDMLGANRRPRTDVEMSEEDWEDHTSENYNLSGVNRHQANPATTDLSDAYQTAHETESNFETADERQNTESEAFETGAESLAGDSTDELTETESTAPNSQHRGSTKHNRPSLAFRSIGTRDSYLSTASTSAGEEEDLMQTPVQSQPSRFKLRNGRSSTGRQTQIYEGTPDSIYSQVTAQNSPATIMTGRSPPAVEQSLFAELEGINDNGSSFSTPARSDSIATDLTPGLSDTPSRFIAPVTVPTIAPKPIVMVDSAMMTEPWQPEPVVERSSIVALPEPSPDHLSTEVGTGSNSRVVSVGEFPLPPSIATSPVRNIDIGTQVTPQKPATHAIDATPEHSVQYTPTKLLQESPVRGTNTFITPPKTVWDTEHESDPPLTERGVVVDTPIQRPSLTYSGLLTHDSAPLSPVQPKFEAPTALAYSNIITQETHPVAPPPSLPPTAPLPAIPVSSKQSKSNTEQTAIGAASGGILAGAAAALGLGWAKEKESPTVITEDKTAITSNPTQAGSSLHDISGNAVLRKKTSARNADLKQGTPVMISSNDQSSQTSLTAQEIERALQMKKSAAVVPTIFSDSIYAPAVPTKSIARSPDLSEASIIGGSLGHSTSSTRPSSSSGHRPSTANKQHPPLPSDYKTNIARANSQINMGPTRKDSTTQAVGMVMGPPLLPASAMRRPKTPAESTRSPSRENATPRITNSIRQRNNESQLSHRSSLSSFASEVDERFNNRAGPLGRGYEPAPGTDPRMIQAITQTMIGEYLWKYTRKAGSKEMSSTRHRRYFWVHPYTKTLYWSTSDPSVPGAKECTSRSVPIESIRVVSDDNPMPPGLHRKSLEITTPSRKVKFTAPTGQRHETWFNALSYLLLRGEAPDTYGAYSTGGNEITRDDIDEFRVGGYDPHLIPNDRVSMSSYNSRTTTGTSKRISGAIGSGQRQPLPSNVVASSSSRSHNPGISHSSVTTPADSGRISRTEQSHEIDKNRTIRANSVSRVSKMLGSITGRSSKQQINEPGEAQASSQNRGPSRQSNSIYDASVISANRDSAEETRREMLRQEPQGQGAGLENVRACCDGKHDVSTLDHTHRHQDKHRALNSMSDRINRSMSKRV